MTKPFEYPPDVMIKDGFVSCPQCNTDADSFVMKRVDVFSRNSAGGIRIAVVDGGRWKKIDDANTGNPSAKDDAVVVDLLCPQCDGTWRLKVFMHHGKLMITW